MTEAMRDMIAQLMGSQKDDEDGRDLIAYNHPSVCRAYLVGACPYDLVPDSRLQGLLNCYRVHEPAHKADYQKAQARKDHFYDVDAFDSLEHAVKVVDGEIARIQQKLDRETRDQNDTAEQMKTQKIDELDAKISKAVEEMEALGNMGKVEESIKLSKSVEELRLRKSELEAQTEVRPTGPGNASRLRVCEECGAQLNIMDHESRIADHYNGKMHLGMLDVREKYNQMKETIEDRRLKRREEIGDTYPIPASRFADRRPYRRNSPKRHPRDEDRGNRRRSRSRSRDRDRNSRRYDDRSHRNRDREPYRDRDRERDRRERR